MTGKNFVNKSLTGGPHVSPLFKYEKNGCYKETKTNQVIPCQLFFLKKYQGKSHEDYQRDNFLYCF
jgi:hypothetical protein